MTAAKRILLVDDDDVLRQSLAEQIQLLDGVETAEAGDGAAALEAVRAGGFSAILLDSGLPDMDGHALCRRLRQDGVRCPIILLTAPGTEADALAGIEAGASDQIAKPFRLGGLIARLTAQLRQFEQSEEPAVAIGPYRFQPAAKLLLDEAADRRIRLTEKEAAILKHLYRAGETVGRETLLGEVWGYNAGVTTHTLETHIYRLRQKMERDPSNAEILVTEPGGYRLVP